MTQHNSRNTQFDEQFASHVFNDAVMKERLPETTYKALRKTISEGVELDKGVADVVASAMMNWATEKGATHFTHWFQPMTGVTAEKHDAFVRPTADGKLVVEFSGKELIQGEPDASSFPSGGLRSTFEARGYTAWDCTSPAFVKNSGGSVTLYIPTVFCSYTGQALDKKTPLLRSMEALNRQAMRILKLFGNKTAKRVITTAGPEQEYFLVDKNLYEERLDLMVTGRTLFGAPAPKGQELEDHYFGAIKERASAFMNELNWELWKLGVPAKTQHNEVAPAQFELALVYSPVNVATDHNQIVMETMRRVANRHDLVCLLHEKPYAGINGSGKHNNWSMMTDDGHNLLEPGHTPQENAQFLLFLSAVICAVDKYCKVLRATVANSGNDHRLGANEAPPAIVSIYLGDQLSELLEQLAQGAKGSSKEALPLQLGVITLPEFPKDLTDRNRTSPFAFTGNKFEFRMVGSSQSVAAPNFVLNTIVADVLQGMADEIEKKGDVKKAVTEIICKIAKENKRVIFNGNNYSEEWVKEAQKRGLPNIKNCVDSIECITDEDCIAVFERQKVLSKLELHARQEILFEQYSKQMNIEAQTMIRMASSQILPACIAYAGQLAESVGKMQSVGVNGTGKVALLKRTADWLDELKTSLDVLESAVQKTAAIGGVKEKARACRDLLSPAMNALRHCADRLEMVVDHKTWPIPSYAELLFLI